MHSLPFQISASSFRRLALLISALLLLVLNPIASLQCDGANTPSTSAQESDSVTFSVGFDGHAKLGNWIPFTVSTPDQMEPQHFAIEVLDGDDTAVTYEGELSPVTGELNKHQGWVKLGRKYGKAKLKLLDANGIEVGEKRSSLKEAGSVKSTNRLAIWF